jgi:beta-glucanase (GH16 family)
MPVGNLSGWRQIFVDDFTGTIALGEWSECSSEPFICSGLREPYRTNWWAYTEGWADTSKNGTYSPSKVLSVADGVLDMYIHTKNGVHRVAAPVPLTYGRDGSLGQLYGRYVIRFRADSLHGYKIVSLLWPTSEIWPRDGEIDFPEGNLDATIAGYVHRQNATVGNDQDAFFSDVPMSGSWHTTIIEWEPDMIRFILDGQVIGTSTKRIPNTPMHWVIQTETNLNGYEPADNVAGHVLIDWVAVYARQ